MRHRKRLLAPFFLAVLALAVTAPGAFALTVRYPTQSLGNRGADVRAIQATLISLGYPMAFDGVFGTATADGRQGLPDRARPARRRASSTTSRGAALLTPIGPGSTGMLVRVLQRQLIEKMRYKVPVDGVYGTSTKAAVIAFQKHFGLNATGAVGSQTWRWLLWHYDRPSFNTTTLCDYSVGNGLANWGTGAAIAQIEAAAKVVAAAGYGRVAIGDIGLEHGGAIRGPHDPPAGPRRRHPAHPRRPPAVPVSQQLQGRVIRPDGHPRAHQGDPRDRARAREAHLLQRPGAHQGRARAAVRRPRRPPAHPLLREGPLRRGLRLLRPRGVSRPCRACPRRSPRWPRSRGSPT